MAKEYLAVLQDQGLAEATMDKNKWLLLDLAPHCTINPKADHTNYVGRHSPTAPSGGERGRRETARRLRGVVGSVFRYAIVNLKAQSDPTRPPGLAAKVQA